MSPPEFDAEPLPAFRPELAEAAVLVAPGPAPGPAARFSRTAGQGGGALVVVQLWQAFGWLGADGWSAEEAAARWPAVTAAVLLAVSGAQNLANWWRGRASQI